MPGPTAIVLSRGQSDAPGKRALEETIVAGLREIKGVRTLVVPHLYDLRPHGPAVRALREIPGSFVVLSWLYNRAAHWILDQHHIRGRAGQTTLTHAWDRRMERAASSETHRWQPDRDIFHFDLRLNNEAGVYLDEIKRLVAERQRHDAQPDLDQNTSPAAVFSETSLTEPIVIAEQVSRRWYPVIDFSQCTNCMECIDFCLFGVYGIDQQERIIVEQPDNCRKGCPACSRVCPENAIMFPQHKTPGIAGDPALSSDAKIDLSRLFGKPDQLDTAAKEREEHLRRSGPPHTDSPPTAESTPQRNDELDDLIDELDEFDL
ncbi:MAG: ATP-binding protein [Planctomycetota bacterium]